MEALLISYAKKNCETPRSLLSLNGSFLDIDATKSDIEQYTYLTDDDGQIFIKQINDYIRYLELDNAIGELLKLSSIDIPDTFSQTEDGVADINFSSVDTTLLDNYIGENITRTGETTEDLTGIDSDSFLGSIITTMSHHLEYTLLSCIVSDPSSVSTACIDKVTLPSVTCQLSEDGFDASYGYYEDSASATLEKVSLCEYICHTFDCYTAPSDDGPLKYQMEYIISGQNSDDANLINTAYQLISLRTGLNLIHLLTDSDKFNAAWSIAKSATSVPGLPYIIQGTILIVWATAEAVIDIRDLLSGNNVPLFKTADQWNLSIKGLLNFSKDTPSGNADSSGISYSRYLEMLIAIQNNISVCYRTMDLIQMELCSNYNQDFRVAKCVTGLKGSITYNLPALLWSKTYSYSSHLNFNYN